MFAGHLGAGLMLQRAQRSVGLGSLFLAAMLLDLVLWILVLFGVETVRVPPGYTRAPDLVFDFPYSHSLAASTVWSCLGLAVGWWMCRTPANRFRAALALAAAVFSHFVLDWMVHGPELPLAGRGSARLGLGGWRHLPLAWTVEGLIAAIGLYLYLRSVPLTRARQATLVAVLVLVLAMTVAGQATTAPPPKPTVMATSSLATILVLVVFGWWLERPSTGHGGA
jgi:hypothetical protein